jgi:hypothetical protein
MARARCRQNRFVSGFFTMSALNRRRELSAGDANVIDAIADAVANYLTLITVAVSLLVPSLWISAAAGVTVAMIGVIAFSHAHPGSQVVAAWLIAQVATACITNFIRRLGTAKS